MTEFCHRCGDELPASPANSPFCPHCGAPQLYFPNQEQTESAPVDTTGELPPPRPKLIEWKAVIQCALLVGLVAGALSVAALQLPSVKPLSSLWTLSASLIALALYRKRRPQARLDAKIGARIGLVVGLIAVISIAASMAVAGVVARYGLHNLATFDAEIALDLHQQLERAQASNPLPKEVVSFMNTNEFRAGIALFSTAMVSTLLILLSTVGGALSGILNRRENYPPATPG
jgi:hypothetical protein